MVKGYEVEFVDHLPDEGLLVDITAEHGPSAASWHLRMPAELALRMCEDIINGLAEREYHTGHRTPV